MSRRVILRRKRRKLNKNFEIVVIDQLNKKLQKIGYYKQDEKKEEKILKINKKELIFWIANGAKLSEKVQKLIKGLIE